MADTQSYYQILGLVSQQHDPVIPFEQLRQAYKQSLLHHHPDKQDAGSKRNPQGPTVDEISEAYRVLSDQDLRSQYDCKLRMQSTNGEGDEATRHTGMETVDLEELGFNDETSTWVRGCRCGSVPAYVITEPELEKNIEFGELITGCKGCSLWLKVLFTVEE